METCSVCEKPLEQDSHPACDEQIKRENFGVAKRAATYLAQFLEKETGVSLRYTRMCIMRANTMDEVSQALARLRKLQQTFLRHLIQA